MKPPEYDGLTVITSPNDNYSIPGRTPQNQQWAKQSCSSNLKTVNLIVNVKDQLEPLIPPH
ncbi:MAG: hypothetical protein HQ491_02985 [Bacteroidetes bacterium]|nr:hypothetical protein [Bacteroidota bacterium]